MRGSAHVAVHRAPRVEARGTGVGDPGL
jgi:hypothetical protein